MAMVPFTRLIRPHQLGWLRRPELDGSKTNHVWEKPTGEIFVHDSSRGPLLLVAPTKRKKEDHG